LRDHAFDLALHGWTRLGPDPDVFELWHSSQAADGANYAGLDDPQIDEALADGRAASDYAARARSYAVFQRRWIELAPSITLYQPLYSYVARSSVGLPDFQQPGGPALLFGPADRFRAVGRWYVNSEREIRGDLRGPR
jgi:peptide/nickel transport system substrate-binding protein